METNKTENNEIKDHLSKLEEISKKFGEIDKKYKEHKKANQNTLYSFAKAVGNTIGVRNSTEPEHKKLTDLKNELDSFIITEKEFTNQLKDQSISSIQKATATKSSIEGVNNFESSFNTTKFDKGFTDRLDEISKKDPSISSEILKQLCESVSHSCNSIKEQKTQSFLDLSKLMTKEITLEKIKSQGGQNVMFVHQGKGNQGQGGNTH